MTAARGRGGLTERAYTYVRDGILRGQFPVASVLAEEDVAAALSVSRTPVRQALGQLLQEGLVEIGARRQVIVRGFTNDQRAEILMLREALEGLAVRRACELMAEDNADDLRLLLLRQGRAARAGDEEKFLDLDEEFHLGIAQAAGMPILHRVLGQLRGFVRVVRLGSKRPPSVLARVVAEHEHILDALERRNADEALEALRRHLYTSDYAVSDSLATAGDGKR